MYAFYHKSSTLSIGNYFKSQKTQKSFLSLSSARHLLFLISKMFVFSLAQTSPLQYNDTIHYHPQEDNMKRNKQKEIEIKLNEIIEKDINPQLSSHMGGALLSAFEDGIAYIQFTGSCRGCYAADDTLENIVKPALMNKIPQLKDVVIDDSVSEDLLDFARSLLRGGDK